MTSFSSNFVAGVLAGGLAVLVAAPATAQRFGTSRVDGIELKAQGAVLWSNPNFLSPQSLCKQIYDLKPEIDNLVNLLVHEVTKKLPKGMALVRHKLDLSPGCVAEVAYVVEQITVNVTMTRNIFFTNVTLPTFLGQRADPRFSVDFDMTAGAIAPIPKTAAQGLSLGTSKVRVFGIKPDGQNATGDVAVAVAKLVDDLAGLGFAEKLAHGFDLYQFRGVKQEFGKLESVLRERGQNARIQHSYDSSRRMLTLNLVVQNQSADATPRPATPMGEWIGKWDTRTNSGGHYELAFSQSGDKLVGVFKDLNGNVRFSGTLTGTLNGRQLTYTYSQPAVKGSGDGVFILEEGGKGLRGNGKVNDAAKTPFSWWGTRADVKRCPSGLKGPNCDVPDVR